MSEPEANRAGTLEMAAALRYSIRPKDPAAHLYEVKLTVEKPDPHGQVFAMPAWIPGSYMIRDYAKHVVSICAESDGLAVELSKLDKSRWQAAPTQRPLTVTAEIYGYDPSVRGAHVDTSHAYFNGPCVFLSVAGQEDTPCELEISPPTAAYARDWRVATAMRRKDAELYGFGKYEADDYAELIDHPVEIGHLLIGEFDVNDIPHTIAIRGHTRVDIARVCHDLQRVCAQQMKLLGVPEDLDRYLFLLHAPGKAYGGLEHRWSSSLVCARENLPLRRDSDISDGYRKFLGLVSHEYFHLWNVKRMKPAAFTPYDLTKEIHTGLLWVFEGITSYYDDLALVRSGLISPQSYLELLGQTITRVLRSAGRLRQSVEESSFDAWTKFYKQDANASNAIVSYYTKGSLIALALDLKLRLETEGKTTLDDVMRECWKRWGQEGEGMPERGLEHVAAKLSELDLSDFFDATVRGTGELPLPALLSAHGVRYHLRCAGGSEDKGGKPAEKNNEPGPWLGATLEANNGNSIFTVVMNGGPAELAGVAPGDAAVALDGLALTAANCDRLLSTYRDGDALELVVFRGDELITTRVKLANAPKNTCYLRLDDDASEAASNRCDAWLQVS
ncbi:MAG: PDZ domain-containing protein [Gammaproteobacteria bacterium]|nr:PDZ domain-containing protein [Gammaproteobacteria bacterium]